MDTVNVGGVNYIKAGKAAKAVGYTADYVGQLCRAGKVDARQIGRTWYVRDGGLEEHKGGKTRSNKQKTQEHLEAAIRETRKDEGRIYKGMYMPDAMPAYRKRLMEESIAYETDESPLVPPVRKDILTGPTEDPSGTSSVDIEREVNVVATVPAIATAKDVSQEALGDKREAFQSTPVMKETSVPVKPRLGISLLQSETSVGIEREITPREPISATATDTLKSGSNGVSQALMRPLTTAVIPTMVVTAITALLFVSMLLENVWVYQAGGDGIIDRPYFETSYGLAAVSEIVKDLSR